jgi:hypothetical protein
VIAVHVIYKHKACWLALNSATTWPFMQRWVTRDEILAGAERREKEI